MLSVLCVVGLSACGTSESQSTGTKKAPDTTETEAAAETGKSLVVYYSATGTTENVANIIAKETNADLFVVTPTEAYTDKDLNWSDADSRVSKENDDESLRDVELTTTTVENWDAYDTVYIGYPIWWGIAAWPVDSFVKANDFTGKTVVPFATASSSGIGESGELLEKMAGIGTWVEGECFHGGASDGDVQDWIHSLGL